MRGKVLTASLVVLVGASSVGCKTMPNMAWWKTASKDAPEAAVLAHSAPELPSEIAKQAEGVAANTTEQLAGGVAAPFVPSVGISPAKSVASTSSPGPFPSTEAPGFKPTAPVVAAVPATTESANLGSLAMPYNPNAVPPAAAAAAPAAAPAAVDRYAAATTSGSSTKPSASPYTSPTPRYGQQVATAPVATTNAPTTPAEAPSSTDQIVAAVPSTPASQEVSPAQVATPPAASSFAAVPTASLGNRYAQTASATMPTTSLPVDNSLTTPVTPANPAATIPTTSTIAEASPYRPGGTSTYPGALDVPASVQIATRPDAPAAETPVAPSTQPAMPQVPRYR